MFRHSIATSLALMFIAVADVGVCASEFGNFIGKPIFLLDKDEINLRCKKADYTPGNHDRILQTTFTFVSPKKVSWTVPPGTCVNGASIPSAFWSFIGGPLSGKYVEASIVHDHFCSVKTRSPHDTHLAFYDAMRSGGVSATKAKLMYEAVKKFGPNWTTVLVKGKPRKITGRSFLYYAVVDELSKLADRKDLSELELSDFLKKTDALAKDKRPSTHPQLPENCSVLIPKLSTNDFSGSLVVCDTSPEKTKLVALQNIRNLRITLDGVLNSNRVFLDEFRNYLSDPTEANWQMVVRISRNTRVVVSEAMRSWFKANGIPPASPDHVMSRIETVLATRSSVLGNILISGNPPSRANAVTLFHRYIDAAEKLSRILGDWEGTLEDHLSTS